MTDLAGWPSKVGDLAAVPAEIARFYIAEGDGFVLPDDIAEAVAEVQAEMDRERAEKVAALEKERDALREGTERMREELRRRVVGGAVENALKAAGVAGRMLKPAAVLLQSQVPIGLEERDGELHAIPELGTMQETVANWLLTEDGVEFAPRRPGDGGGMFAARAAKMRST